jgi:hypothetical protein
MKTYFFNLHCYIVRRTLVLLFILISILCSCDSAENQKRCGELQKHFPNYSFTSRGDYYLFINLNIDTIDTFELKQVYRFAIWEIDSSKKHFKKRDDVMWSEVSVSNRDGKYLFNIGYDGDSVIFWKK